MKALTWHGNADVRFEDVPDPQLQLPTDAIIEVTSTGLCGSDLHLYTVLGPFMTPGDVLGHEPMGRVVEVGSAVGELAVGDRVVIPFNISCGHCFMCDRGLQSQCETTQVRDQGMGAALLGYTKLYGQVPGGQAELLRVPQAQYGPIKVPEGPADDRFLYCSDVLPTAWQAVEYAHVPDGGSLVVLGLGPIGDMATRIATLRGVDVIGVDVVPERLERVRARGVDALEVSDDLADRLRERADGRGPDAVVDAVGMEAHGSPSAHFAQRLTALLPDSLTERLMRTAGVDRLAALYSAIDIVRRGGTISLSGVYGGMTDPMPMQTLFDKQIRIRMGQANVKRWIPDIMPLLTSAEDPLGVDSFATHRIPLSEGPAAYEMFQKKRDGAVKVVFQP